MSTHLVASPRTTVRRIRLDLAPRSHPFQVTRTRIQRGMKKQWKRKPNRTWSRCFLWKKERVAPSTMSRDPCLCPSLSSPLDRAARTGHARAQTGAPRSAGHGHPCPSRSDVCLHRSRSLVKCRRGSKETSGRFFISISSTDLGRVVRVRWKRRPKQFARSSRVVNAC